MNRRDLLKLGVSAGLASLIPSRALLASLGMASSPPVTPFQVPLPIPPVLAPTAQDSTTDYYDVTMRETQVQILPGYPPTTVWAYNDTVPGPTIKARQGRRVVVHQANALSVATSVHLHGGHVAAEHDGHPNALIPPGSSRDYEYPNTQSQATLWYHDHAVHRTAENVYRGLAGFYILQDDLELSLNLPRDAYDVPLVIQDKLFSADGSLNYPPLNQNTLQMGFMGDTILVNGAVQPYFPVANRKYRFRILNGSNARQYRLALSSGQSFVQIGTEGGLLPAPAARSSMVIAPAERLDVVIDFSIYPLGTQVVLRNTFGSGRTGDVMRFDVVRAETDDSTVPATLCTIPRLSNPVVTRIWRLSFNGTDWVISDRTYDPNRVDARPRRGQVERWVYRNHSQHPHPMHPHLGMFQIERRFPGSVQSYETGWKDTVNVQSGEELHMLIRFDTYTGRYVHHCHNLEHEDHDMMNQFEVVP
jgi:FtsP/CotA-like multicopper oxidase with cupredoxin domain